MIRQLLAVTTDNASSNASFIKELARILSSQAVPFKEDNWIRCMAHAINLAVQEAVIPMEAVLSKVLF